jgi:Tfp pilus assembly protein PilF
VSLQDELFRLKAKAAAERGRVAQAQGDPDAAAYFFAHSLEWAETPEARVGQAQAYSYQGKLDQAVAECKKAIALDPTQGQAYNDIGVYLMQQGLDDDAEGWLEQAVAALNMDDRHFPHYNLGRIYERRHELKRSMAAYEAALIQLPDFDSAKGALDRVKRKLERPVGNEP